MRARPRARTGRASRAIVSWHLLLPERLGQGVLERGELGRAHQIEAPRRCEGDGEHELDARRGSGHYVDAVGEQDRLLHVVGEAILLSHRVYVMTRAPARIKLMFTVPFAAPRSLDLVGSAEFAALKYSLTKSLWEEEMP